MTYDLLLTGGAAFLAIAGLAGWLISFRANKQKKAEAKPRIATVTAPEAQKSMAANDTDAKVDAGKTPHHAAVAPAIAEPGAKEAGTGDDNDRTRDLRQAIKNLDSLPAMPIIAQKLLALEMDTEEGQRKLLVLIEQEPQISARIIGLANSATVGTSRTIKTVKDAALLLGIKRVQSVAAGIAVISLLMEKAPAGEFNIQGLWLHSFRVAFALQGIARFMPEQMRPPDDQIFLAGMLHDIGYLALAFLDPQQSNKLHNYLAAEPERPSLEIEREIVEICHDELGAELARHWNLPKELVSVLRYHHDPYAAGAEAGQPLVQMINIAEKLLPSLGIIEYVAATDISNEEWQALGISPDNAEEVKEVVKEQAERASHFASSLA
jgi:putative nucleotidyltransferase with HDIG domain